MTVPTRQIQCRRFVLEEEPDDEDHERSLVTDLALVERTLFRMDHKVVNGAPGSVRSEQRAHPTQEAAERALTRCIEGLRKKGYLEDEPVTHEVPDLAAPGAKAELLATRAEAEAARAARRADGEAAAAECVAAWTERGRDVALSFVEQCRRGPRGLLPWDLAAECLVLAEGVFGVRFARRTRAFDEEHGSITPVPLRRLHEYYVGPLEVFALAQHHLEKGAAATDDADTTVKTLHLRRRFLAAERP